MTCGGGQVGRCWLNGKLTKLRTLIFVFPFNFAVLQKLRGKICFKIIIPNVYLLRLPAPVSLRRTVNPSKLCSTTRERAALKICFMWNQKDKVTASCGCVKRCFESGKPRLVMTFYVFARCCKNDPLVSKGCDWMLELKLSCLSTRTFVCVWEVWGGGGGFKDEDFFFPCKGVIQAIREKTWKSKCM